ncbi:MAG: hypothetical protein ABIF80_03645 [Patescibacteria group bacterium]
MAQHRAIQTLAQNSVQAYALVMKKKTIGKKSKIESSSKLRLKRVRGKNAFTLQEAEQKGFGTSNSIKKQILRGVLPAEKIGTVWLVNKRHLEAMVKRRQEWLTKRNRGQSVLPFRIKRKIKRGKLV